MEEDSAEVVLEEELEEVLEVGVVEALVVEREAAEF